ncbi:DDB1- and CUL4-associated factor 13, partial [Goodea atripinnis]
FIPRASFMNWLHSSALPWLWAHLPTVTVDHFARSYATTLAPRQREAVNYSQKLKEKFQHHPQIRRIARHRHLPKNIYHQKNELRIMKEARRRKEMNVRKHSKPGSVPVVSEKEKHVVSVVK